MRESFRRVQVVAAAPGRVWEQLLDFNAVAGWIRIVGAAEEIAPLQRYRAVLEDRLGPFKLRADLEIKLTEVIKGVSVTATAAGEDRQVASRIGVEARLAIRPAEPGTEISLDGHYEVLGRVATLGAGSIRKKADKVLDDFFSAAAAALRA